MLQMLIVKYLEIAQAIPVMRLIFASEEDNDPSINFFFKDP